MSIRDVKESFARVAQDKKIDVRDVDTVLSSAGAISKDEQKALQTEADKYAGQFDPDASSKLREKLGEITPLRNQATETNKELAITKRKLDAEVQMLLTPGEAHSTFGGSPIPEAVKKVVTDALAKGAVAYDVREMKPDPVYNTEHGATEITLDGKYNPYAQEQVATDSMAFDFTELTPAKIQADLAGTSTWREVNGYEGTGAQQSAKFKDVTGTPNGRITELYDEASWGETKARGPGGQKYASNFAILADGSFHAVPASRRSAAEPWRILTTASLARGKQMLFNGHLHMEKGVVTYVGLSGRLSKMAEKGEAKFVDPIELLKAWGFKMAPNLAVTNEG